MLNSAFLFRLSPRNMGHVPGTPYFIFLGGSEFRLRQGFGSAKTLGRAFRRGALARAAASGVPYCQSRVSKISRARLLNSAFLFRLSPRNMGHVPGTPYFIFLGGSEFRLRQGFGSAKTLGRAFRRGAQARAAASGVPYCQSRVSKISRARLLNSAFLFRLPLTLWSSGGIMPKFTFMGWKFPTLSSLI